MAGFVAMLACFGAAVQASPPVAVGIVSWPTDAEGARPGPDPVEECLARSMHDAAPEITITRQRAVRDALYPWLERSTEPASEAGFSELLAREEVRARLSTMGLRALVAFTAQEHKGEDQGFVTCGGGFGYGGCLGYSRRFESTALGASLWRTDGAPVPVRHESTLAEGNTVIAGLLLPVFSRARTLETACRDLAARLAQAIRETSTPQPDAQ
ncbi:hypothetical protein [Ramlibacter tataouinensis]|uniref:DUF4136 domain-containing protein n=1 Tax=Ramlibacter tataouinensis TaxID=94132 RepID=A0A127JVP6_9BURK|nr:hypothetical protein [Ramlibacter tataouinensis]AMO24067.1 hypothetical protein UC35_15945 [Ramlibacter tataouinensis]